MNESEIKIGARYAVLSPLGKPFRIAVRVLDKTGRYYRVCSVGDRGQLYLLRAEQFVVEVEW